MSRIIAIDYGSRRVGLAVTDPLQIVATPLTTIPPAELVPFLKEYLQKESVEHIVLGYPTREDGRPTHSTPLVEKLMEQLRQTFPEVAFSFHDERYTSRMARRALVSSGARKSVRQNKGNIDQVSATLILQSFLEQKT